MSLRHALLVALANEPCSGYEITQRFDSSLGFFWHATHQQIYRELGKMTDEGLVTYTVVEQADRPDKKIYRPTELGLQELVQWVAQPAPDAPTKDALLIKLFAGYRVDGEILRAEMQRQRVLHRERLHICQQIERMYFTDPDKMPINFQFQYLTLRYGIEYFTMWLAWSEEVMRFLDQQAQNSAAQTAHA